MAKKKPIALAAKAPMTLAAIGADLLERLDTALGPEWRQTCVHVTFGAFVGSLVLLLILLYAGVPIVGS
jgi:hypothetical protein